MIPKSNLKPWKEWLHYAEEADILNVCVFWVTKKEWEDLNPELKKKKLNPRDIASINENLVLSRLEVINWEMIKDWKKKNQRFMYLQEVAKKMLEDLGSSDIIKSIKKTWDRTLIEAQKDKKKFH